MIGRIAPLALVLALFAVGCGPKKEVVVPKAPTKPLLAELKTVDTKVGKGEAIAEGDIVVLHYVGKLGDGTEFDSNQGEDKPPFAFQVGAPGTVPGWSKGIIGMKKGGEREVNIPYELGYGEQGSPPRIPAKADLYFTIQVIDVVKKNALDVFDFKDLKVGTGPVVKKGSRVKISFVASYANKFVFDTTEKRGPEEFVVGAGDVIPGIDAGVVGMKMGGKRSLWLPPALLHTAGGGMSIEMNQPATFEITLLDVK